MEGVPQEDGNMSDKKEKNSDQKAPNWVELIQKNADDLTPILYQLYTSEDLKTNIEDELEKDKKKSE